MKISTSIICLLGCMLTLSSCQFLQNNLSSRKPAGTKATAVAPVQAVLPDTYMRGFDASEVKALEENGISFYDEKGKKTDIFKILSDNGVNWIRLRIWNDYTKEMTASWKPYGFNNLERTIAMAKRAKDNGMKVLLDFHYSDNWADPQKQKCPDMWKGYTNVADLSAAVATWTGTILTQMSAAGCAPDMVQLGNEMEGGICKTNAGFTVSTADSATILNAAAATVRSTIPKCKIMLHMSRGGNQQVLSNFYSNFISKVDCDVVGLSYYPFFSSHGTITQLQQNVDTIVKTYKKQAVIAETSYCYDTNVWMDNTNNEFWTDDEPIAAQNLTTYSGITNGKIVASVENQAGVVREIIEKTAQKGGTGVFYWGGAYLGVTGKMDSSWENQALFDTNGKVLPSIKVMAVKGE